jgi:glucose-6-phosphate dehydrogenase assembly protein OpcA
MTATPEKTGLPGREYPERMRWVGRGVTADDIDDELDRLHRAAGGGDLVLALARTLNLIVVPCSDRREQGVERALDALGSHTPSRTLVLREHGTDGVDATVLVECEAPTAAGRVGLCHDRVLLSMDAPRLEHSASLIAPLLVTDLPTVLWLPEARSHVPDPLLLERAQQLLVDSTSGGDGDLRRLAELAASIRVHDLAWGRLEYWRAAIAAAFEPAERRELLPGVTAVEVRYERHGMQAGLLLAGWIAARARWRADALVRRNGIGRATAVRGDGGELEIRLAEADCEHGCGGVDHVVFSAGSEEIPVERSGATSALRDLFAEALQPEPSFARGYERAVAAAAAMLDGAP